MKQGRTIWKVFPFEYYDLVNMRAWLEEKGREGLFFAGCSLRWAKFRRQTPRTVRYWVEPVPKNMEEPDGELLELFSSCGWQYVGRLWREYFVFLTEDEQARSPHTDDETLLLAMKRSVKHHLSGAIALLVQAIILLTVYIGAAVSQQQPVLELIHTGTLKICYIFFLLLFLLGDAIVQLCQAAGFRRMLRSGLAAEKRPYGRRVRRWYWSMAGSAAVVLLILLSSHLFRNRPEELNTQDYAGNLPFLQLQQVDGADDLAIGGLEYDGLNLGDYLTCGTDVLAPRWLELKQNGRISSLPEPTRIFYWVEYYEAASSELARRLALELEQKHPKGEGATSFSRQEADFSAVEYGAYYAGPEGQFLLLQNGRQVELIFYDGAVELDTLLPKFLQALEITIIN